MAKSPIHKIKQTFKNWAQTFETTFWVRPWKKECHRNSSTSLPRRKAGRIYSCSNQTMQPTNNNTKTVIRIKCQNKTIKALQIALMV